MKTIEELKRFFEVDLLNDLKLLENARHHVIRASKFLGIFVLVLIILAGIAVWYYYQRGLIFVAFSAIICAIAALIKTNQMAQKYKNSFKDRVAERLLHFFDSGLVYVKNRSVNQLLYEESELFIPECRRYDGSGLVHGLFDKIEIEFSQLNTKYKGALDTDGGYYSAFDGLFFVGHLPKAIPRKLLLIPRQDMQEHLKILQPWTKNRAPAVQIDNPEFMEHFVIHSPDRKDAVQLLRTDLTRKLLRFKIEMDRHFYLSFRDTKMFLAIRHCQNVFEPKMSQSALDFQCVKPFFEDILFFASVLDDVQYNLHN